MRLFGSERIGRVMDRLGMEEGQEIESTMVSKAIASAQKRVEGRNFEIRKHLLEYDDVMNSQRTFIYRERNDILDGVDISGKIREYIAEVIEQKIENFTMGMRHPEQWDLTGLQSWFKKKFTIDLDYSEIDPVELNYNDFLDVLIDKLNRLYDQKEEKNGSSDMRIIERLISLQVIDNKWREHLLTMDQLRDGIWAMGYGEKNPLVEYKIEGARLFADMLGNLKEDIIEFLLKVEVRKVEEEAPAPVSHIPAGNEFHAEVGQFGSGGIPTQTGLSRKSVEPEKPVEGGVKRKKTRRSRR
jgi:preprotein translocase subunit SecA